MRRIMRTALAAAMLAAAAGPVAATGGILASTATASEGATFVPMSQALRRCDHSEMQYVGATGYGRASATIGRQGGEVVADLAFATGRPNTPYEVKLIQMPRSSAAPCPAGAVGVSGTTLFTDGAGAATAVLRGPAMDGATGAWVSLTRPSAFSQLPEEFYTSDFVAPL
ncbi:hypothetical protein [Mycolicibacterium sp. S3B2]|uniref:hypothetical protein n=1 Tax=Mycolicibacterium sp. S3B2 TaxID=3415120 RepID=UPI003C7D6457